MADFVAEKKEEMVSYLAGAVFIPGIELKYLTFCFFNAE